MSSTVLVSGGSGYIAGFIIQQLLAEGWTVHTTVRSLSREAELRPLLGGTPETLKFFSADLTADAGWAEAMAGCSHVLHVASPFSSKPPRNPDDLIIPAREGTVRTLRIAKAAGVQRFVQTSSVAAIAYGHGKGHHHFTEADWTNVNSRDAYAYVKSKTVAERAAREWMAKTEREWNSSRSIPPPCSGRSGAAISPPRSRWLTSFSPAHCRVAPISASGSSTCAISPISTSAH